MSRVLLLGVLAAAVYAQEGTDLADRVQRLERAIEEERALGERREARIAELEQALQHAIEALAQAQDRRAVEREIEEILAEKVADLAPAPSSRLSVGAVVVASYRATERGGNTFEIDDRYLRLGYRFSDSVAARYYTDGSLAELEWHAHDLLQLNVGLVVVPFGQFNPRAFPDTFDTLSRPLIYVRGEDVVATPANNPTPLFRSIYSDTGLVLSGNRWSGGNQLYYAAFVTNGLTGDTDIRGNSGSADNNRNKQFGARLAYTIALDRGRAGIGVSGMGGKYDDADSLSYRYYGVDLLLTREGLFHHENGSLSLRAEYVYAPREISVFTTTTRAEERKDVSGAYAILEARLDARWMVYGEADWIAQRAPLLGPGSVILDPLAGRVTSTNRRYSFGVVYKFAIGVVWKNEYSYSVFDQGFSDVQRFSTQLVIPF